MHGNLLPYCVRKTLGDIRVKRYLGKIVNAKPVRTAPVGCAQLELHMLVCRRDVLPALTALLSFLSFYNQRVSLVLSDDGSVTSSQRQRMLRVFPDARWASKDNDGIEQKVLKYPQLHRLWCSNYAPAIKLLRPIVASRCAKVMVLDPDTFFFGAPAMIAHYIESDCSQNVYLHTRQPIQEVPENIRHALDAIPAAIGYPVEEWDMSHYFFNSGLLLFNPATFELQWAEEYLAWVETLDEPTRTQGSIWFGRWTPEQSCYRVLYATSTSASIPFGDEYRLGFHPEKAFNHFLREGMNSPQTLRLLQKRIRGFKK